MWFKKIIERTRDFANKINTFLNRPYPYYNDILVYIKFALGIGFFVSLFLFLFRPFSDGEVHNNYLALLFSLGYGIVTFIIMMINWFVLSRIFPKIFCEKNWKVKNEILFVWWLIFVIGLGNLLFSNLSGDNDLSFFSIIQMEGYTFLIGAMITTFAITLEFNLVLKKDLAATQKMNEILQAKRNIFEKDKSKDIVQLTSDNGKEKVRVNQSDLLFIRSADNYVQVSVYLKDTVKIVLLRSSLKRVEKLLKGNLNIQRCHRAYLVNVDNIDHVAGNTQGYKLSFKKTDIMVPVSRNYSKKIKQKILNFE